MIQMLAQAPQTGLSLHGDSEIWLSEPQTDRRPPPPPAQWPLLPSEALRKSPELAALLNGTEEGVRLALGAAILAARRRSQTERCNAVEPIEKKRVLKP